MCNTCWKESSEYISMITEINKKKASSIEERQRLRDIGRKGGFGKKGYTKSGIYFQSSFEEKCFEYLDQNKIKFDSHKHLPDSSKMSDIYLIDYDVWIELDGIDREKNKSWLGKDYTYWLDKLIQYEQKKLKIYVIKKYEEFVDLICQIGPAATAPALHAGIITGSSPVSDKT